MLYSNFFLYYFFFYKYGLVYFFFFFSSRRRHTRWPRDWSQTCALPISSSPANALEGPANQVDGSGRLEAAIARRLSSSGRGLCLLFDRYDAISPDERALASG